MAYDLNRCPQTEAEATDYIFTLYGRTIGTPANDWQTVMLNSNLPHNVYTPGMKADASWPNFGMTQMWSGGPRGRIFLPAVAVDENGYWTRQIQVIADGPGGLVWAWQWISGHDYAPVQGAAAGGGGGGPIIIPGGGMTEAQVQAMIDASIAAAVAGFTGVQLGDKIALRTNSGLLMGIKGGGPTVEDAPIEFIGKGGDAHAWESLTIEKGE
jgi:hypothetical protein